MKTVIVGNLNIRKEPLVSLCFPYDEVLKQLIKTVPGAAWRSNERVWTVPHTGRVLEVRYIQEILGHKSSKATEIYTHVSTKSIQRIKSPFDDL